MPMRDPDWLPVLKDAKLLVTTAAPTPSPMVFGQTENFVLNLAVQTFVLAPRY
jgi:hypothetical protein